MTRLTITYFLNSYKPTSSTYRNRSAMHIKKKKIKIFILCLITDMTDVCHSSGKEGGRRLLSRLALASETMKEHPLQYLRLAGRILQMTHMLTGFFS